MRINELTEAPLPDDWEKDLFNKKSTFKKRLEYAKHKAQRLGGGSSRVAFIIEYDGRPTVLKLAQNKKGLAQNRVEVDIMKDGYASQNELVLPLIDYDKEHELPQWLQTEKADKMTAAKFREFFDGLDPQQVVDLVLWQTGSRHRLPYGLDQETAIDITDNNEYVWELADLFGNMRDLVIHDISRLSNWGIYKGHPVIIDIGLTADVFDTHYRR